MIPVMLALLLLIVPLRWVAAMILAALIHELGHYIALRLCGVHVFGVEFSLSGARMKVGSMSACQEFICALAGPLCGLSLLMVARWVPRTAICGCIHSVFNLLPIYPLDGGRLIRCVGIGERGCRWIERICLLMIALCGIYGSFVLRLGLLPAFTAVIIIRKVHAAIGLEKRRRFRYNRVINYE